MHISLVRIGQDSTVKYAFEELFRYLKIMDSSLIVDCRACDTYDPSQTNVIWVGLTGSVPRADTDTVRICVKNGSGEITGSNPRAVLIAVYRMLFEMGCRWLHPGVDGELIPKKKLDGSAVEVCVEETASYHHRGICIEGANSYEHIRDMIDWLPKVGMNGYFCQFFTPFTFFDRWYSHDSNPDLPAEPISREDVRQIWKLLEEEITKRGLMYHAVGHGWTCEPLGIPGMGWIPYEEAIPEETRQYLAQVNGKRDLWHKMALNTNLCYSNPMARDVVLSAIVNYCKENPAVQYLHFWLADASNNHCECEECRKVRPSDFYVMMLNELDERMTREGLTQKIVFLIYVDLLWEPEQFTIRNPERFVLMFAPITRTYTTSFVGGMTTDEPELMPYVRNRLKMPKAVNENVARLSRWQAQFSGDSFDFDYHLMWDHVKDPGYYECARILHEDMTRLEQIGLNGMVSCQVQRVSFPTGLPMYAMARGLWDKQSSFEAIAEEYFTAAFGADGAAVEAYLKELSRLFLPPYIRGELPQISEEAAESFAKAAQTVRRFQTEYAERNAEKSAAWKKLFYHGEFCLLLAEMLQMNSLGKTEQAAVQRDAVIAYLNRIEPEMHPALDGDNHIKVLCRKML